MSPIPKSTTAILAEMRGGDGSAAARLLPIVYGELRAMAGHIFQRQPSDHTLQPTAVVHEAYMRLVGQEEGAWVDKAHFLAVAATAMRQVLIDHARRRRAAKRGGGERERVTLDEALDVASAAGVDVLALDDALRELAQLSERQAKVVELRVFGGLTIEECAEALHVGPTTVKSEWTIARIWLKRQLCDQTET